MEERLIFMFEKFLELKPSTILVVAGLLILPLVFLLLKRGDKSFNFTTKMLVYGSLCVALAFVLSYIRLFRLPQGGSITLASMLPILIYAIMFGPIAGIIAGLALGFLQLMQDPYIVHWAQFMLDYPLSYGALGLAGLYRRNFIIGGSIGVFFRFLMNFIAGVIFWGEFTPEGFGVYTWSIVYNGSFIAVDALICVFLAYIPQVKSALNQVRRNHSA